MKTIFLVIYLLSFSVLFPQQVSEEVTQSLTEVLLQQKSFPTQNLQDQTYLSFRATNGFYGKNQLLYIIDDFLSSYRFHTVKISNSNFNSDFGYIFFNLTNGRNKFHIYFSINIQDKNWQIDQITIKEIP